MQNGNFADSDAERNVGSHVTILDNVITSAVGQEDSSNTPTDHGIVQTLESPSAEDATPRGKKRKLAESTLLKRARQISPPWKKIEADGPTSFIEGGRRKSGRTNSVPVELQPPPLKRPKRSGIALSAAEKVDKAIVAAHHHKGNLPSTVKIKSEAFRANGTIDEAAAKVPRARGRKSSAALKYHGHSSGHLPGTLNAKSFSSPAATNGCVARGTNPAFSRRKRAVSPQPAVTDQATGCTAMAPSSPAVDGTNRTRRLKLTFRRPPLPLLHPSNIPAPPRHSTLQDWLEADNPFEGEDGHRLTKEEAASEAEIINRVEAAAKSGGILSKGMWQQADEYIQDVPAPAHAHWDYLLKHVEDFQPRLQHERKEHMILAKRVAQMAVVEYRRRQPQSAEQLLEAEKKFLRAQFRDGMKEMLQMWDQARGAIRAVKEAQHKEDEKIRAKEKMRTMLNRSSTILRKGFSTARVNKEEIVVGPDEDNGHAADEEEDEDREFLSGDDESVGALDSASDGDLDDTSGSEGTEEENVVNEDDMLEPEQLARKYQEMLQVSPKARRLTYASDDDSSNVGEMHVYSDSLHEHSLVDNTGLISFLLEDSTRPQAIDKHQGTDDAKLGVEELGPSQGIDPATVELDELPDVFNENEGSDEDDNNNDDDDESDESNDEDDSGRSSVDGDSDEGGGNNAETSIAAFFSKNQLKYMSRPAVDTPPTSFDEREEEDNSESVNEDDEEPDDELTRGTIGFLSQRDIKTIQNTGGSDLQLDHQSDDKSEAMDIDQIQTETLPGCKEPVHDTLTPPASSRSSYAESVSSVAPSEAMRAIDSLQPSDGDIPSVEVPALLRGQLRGYQHKGLNWLAAMYAQKSNGILADEMGLGKTIQTISLLAHLANNLGIWGPHLVIVPTSVVLNWEVEFKKFLPGFKILAYTGNIEERKMKRMGWSHDNRWHVVITSYQLALRDAAVLKRRRWHYMVLDEAHNIKNFNSLRWQTLLGFNTQARLLLTGTPLQNNLSELWSLLFFLMPEEDENGEFKFKDLKSFQDMFKRPVDQILEHGREAMDEEGKLNVEQLHKILRPHLLRRLKADVEKQMPKKFEHIVPCRLSKRQRQLYDGYMGLANTRESFESGNYLSIINCLMQLRKVCNHPDLFETRQIVTSYAMPKSAIADYEITELLMRRRFMVQHDEEKVNLKVLDITNPNMSTRDLYSTERLAALRPLFNAAEAQSKRIQMQSASGAHTTESALAQLGATAMKSRLDQLRLQLATTNSRMRKRPTYPDRLLQKLLIRPPSYPIKPSPTRRSEWTDHYLNTSSVLCDMVKTLPQRAQLFETYIGKFACVTPAVVAPDVVLNALTPKGVSLVRQAQSERPYSDSDYDPFHTARIRLSIAFPDRALIQYDCGKLQALARLLRQLQVGGHRALIFTQMTKVLDILEQFLNLHGYVYLRLDGSTKIEQRQAMTERFNNDPRIPVFILSSRSGGLGINLTGADTVIFYDLDWNPAMDKQCQDRCHRIGQTRDVHIYRFVSEGTIEANILRKSNQKRMLDDVVIQEGDFTTEHLNRMDLDQPADDLNLDDSANTDEYAQANAALDKVLGGRTTSGGAIDNQKLGRALARAEDKEDVEAANLAAKDADELDVGDKEDFAEDAISGSNQGTSTTGQATPAQEAGTPAPVVHDDVAATPADATMIDADAPTGASAQESYEARQQPIEGVAAEDDGDSPVPSIDDYMVRFMEWEMRDYVVKEPNERTRNRRGKKGGGVKRDRAPRTRR